VKQIRVVVIILVMLFMISCACFPAGGLPSFKNLITTLQPDVENTSTKIPPKVITSTVTNQIINEPTTTEVTVEESTKTPTETAEPLSTNTVEPTLEPSPTETEAAQMEEWRLPLLPGAVFIANDTAYTDDWVKEMDKQAANLAIPAPFFWDVYQLTDGTRYRELQQFFPPILVGRSYKLSNDVQGSNEVYLMTFLKSDTKSKTVIQFQSSTSKRPALLIVIYKNPQ
jgi:hypothetical protein